MAREALSGKILFLGGPLDSNVREVNPWRTAFAIYLDGWQHVYRLERVRSAGYEPAAIFFVYVHGSFSTRDIQARMYPPPVLECPRFGISLVRLATVGRKYRAKAPR